MPAWITGNLNVVNQRQVCLDLLSQIATHDLAMVEVHLQEQIVAADPLNQLARLRDSREKIARVVPGIEGFDEQTDAMGLQRLRGPAQIAYINGLAVLPRHTRRERARHGV